jgi:hypothetical protein
MPDWLHELILTETRTLIRAILRKHGIDVSTSDRASEQAARAAATVAVADVPPTLPKPE